MKLNRVWAGVMLMGSMLLSACGASSTPTAQVAPQVANQAPTSAPAAAQIQPTNAPAAPAQAVVPTAAPQAAAPKVLAKPVFIDFYADW